MITLDTPMVETAETEVTNIPKARVTAVVTQEGTATMMVPMKHTVPTHLTVMAAMKIITDENEKKTDLSCT